MVISRRSRQKFADFAAGYGTVRTIEEAYAAHGFELPSNFAVPADGQRRAVCAAAEQKIDASDTEAAERLLRVYVDAIDDWGRDTGMWSEPTGLVQSAQSLVKALRRDGAPIDDEGRFVFGAAPAGSFRLSSLIGSTNPRCYCSTSSGSTKGSLATRPRRSGSAKELCESTFKFVFNDYGVTYDARSASLTDLYKLVANELAHPRLGPNQRQGQPSQQANILQNLSTAVQNLAELRNELGLGHGRTTSGPALARHARLAANAARTVVDFTLSTWHGQEAEIA